ncbi:MAG: polysaccharide deacetylase family protein [Clostridiales bacterium]|nr:polysaccharide deacetylase family protein [Clostridiales bacterium]
MECKISKADISLFLKTGIFVLSFIAILFSTVKYIPKAITVSNHTNSKKFPICSVETSEAKVALTFDIDSSGKDLDLILDILSKNNVKATFFVTGKWIESNRDGIIRIVSSGHDIGNHSYSHKNMDLLDEEECMKEILYVHNLVKDITNVEMKLFRPPYGDFNNTIIHIAKDLGYETIRWDIDSMDWKDYGIRDLINQTANNKDLRNGSIIVFKLGTKYTAEALDEVIESLKDKGYNLVGVNDLIYPNDYIIDVTGRQYRK